MLYPSFKQVSEEFIAKLKELASLGVIIVDWLYKEIKQTEFEEPFATLSCEGTCFKEAKQNLLNIIKLLKLDDNIVPASWFIKNL